MFIACFISMCFHEFSCQEIYAITYVFQKKLTFFISQCPNKKEFISLRGSCRLQSCFVRKDMSVICPRIAEKLAVAVFTGLLF